MQAALAPNEKVGPDWWLLPGPALDRVLHHLPVPGDKVSVGQVCSAWRAAAKRPEAWRHVQLIYEWDLYTAFRRRGMFSSEPHLRHRAAKRFCRVVRFAPYLEWITVGKVMRPAARKALTNSSCKTWGVKMNGRLAWTAAFLLKQQETLQEVTLVNPTEQCLLTAMRLPKLRSLRLKHENQKNYQVPVMPTPAEPYAARLATLICEEEVRAEAVEALMVLNTGTLQELHVCCLPSAAALAACTLLRRVGVRLRPDLPAAEQQELRGGLRGKKLKFLAFRSWNWDTHNRKACQGLRKTLAVFLEKPESEVLCRCCPSRSPNELFGSLSSDDE